MTVLPSSSLLLLNSGRHLAKLPCYIAHKLCGDILNEWWGFQRSSCRVRIAVILSEAMLDHHVKQEKAGWLSAFRSLSYR